MLEGMISENLLHMIYLINNALSLAKSPWLSLGKKLVREPTTAGE